MEIDTEEPPDLIEIPNENDVTAKPSSPAPPTAEMEDLAVSKVPLTIITGYLGSGKTTLVNYILNAQHGKKIAVILNEFGPTTTIERRAINISQPPSSSSSPPKNSADDAIDFLTLGNGCICCSVKDAGLNAIEQLLARHASSPSLRPFDAIVLETSGLADPGGIVPSFWADEGLGSSVRLDGVVTVVDAGNVGRELDEPNADELASGVVGGDVVVGGADGMMSGDDNDFTGKECAGTKEQHETVAHLQLSSADSILLNKCDTVSAPQLGDIESRIRSINAIAKLTHTTFSRVPTLAGIVTELNAYDTFTPASAQGHKHAHLDPTITTLTIPLPVLEVKQVEELERWLREVLWERSLPLSSSSPLTSKGGGDEGGREDSGLTIHRTKALFTLVDGTERMVQGVREVFEITTPASSTPASSSQGDDESVKGEGMIVFIGRGLKGREESVRRSLLGALGL